MHVDRNKVQGAIAGVFVGMLATFVLALLAYGFRVGDALIAVLWILPLNLCFAYTYARKGLIRPEPSGSFCFILGMCEKRPGRTLAKNSHEFAYLVP